MIVLYISISVALLKAVKLLNSAGASLDAMDNENFTAVHMATIYGYYYTVELMADLGANLDLRDSTYGLTPLGLAVVYNNEVIPF